MCQERRGLNGFFRRFPVSDSSGFITKIKLRRSATAGAFDSERGREQCLLKTPWVSGAGVLCLLWIGSLKNHPACAIEYSEEVSSVCVPSGHHLAETLTLRITTVAIATIVTGVRRLLRVGLRSIVHDATAETHLLNGVTDDSTHSVFDHVKLVSARIIVRVDHTWTHSRIVSAIVSWVRIST